MSAGCSPDTPATLRWSGCTERGGRANNEDSFVGLCFDSRDIQRLGKSGEASLADMDFAFGVSDGMGGANAGEFASNIAVEKITTRLTRHFRRPGAGPGEEFAAVITELFDEIHRALVYLGDAYDECRGMEATLSLCWFSPGRIYYGHIGDSRIYLHSGRQDDFRQLSRDDTHVGWLFRNGKLNEREARNHPRRNLLQKSLGGRNQFVKPQFGVVDVEPGDTVLLCTDGVHGGLYDRRLHGLVRDTGSSWRDGEPPAEQVVRAALAGCGKDNTTALVVNVV